MSAEPIVRGAEDGRPARARRVPALAGYLAFGTFFGLVLAKAEVVSWFRIQEMFRFQGFHMYGVIGSAVLVAAVSLALLRRTGRLAPRSGCDPSAGGLQPCGWTGEPAVMKPKERTPGLVRYWAGGTLFGLGWALLGACPGPLYILIGHGETVYAVGLAAALLGTWTYGRLESRLPH